MSLYDLLQKPEAYAPSKSIWTDKYIAPQMLISHLDPNTDAASFRPERIERTCAFLYEKFKLSSKAILVDLGCGPGLYTQWFSQKGVFATGIDISGNSISYARKQAEINGLDIEYIVDDYRNLFGADCYDAAILISADYGVLSPSDRRNVLHNVYMALHSGGRFAFDVVSDSVFRELKDNAVWQAQDSGFMRPHPHVTLNKTWIYPQEHAWCDMCIVIDDSVSEYYVYQTAFSAERIAKEVESAGFVVECISDGIEGKPYKDGCDQIGVIVRKP